MVVFFTLSLFLSCHDRANTPYIIKYNLKTNSFEAQITLSDYTPRATTYQWGGHSGVDLAVDEQGLWVLWGSRGNSNRLKAAKIDHFSNRIVRTWSLNTGIPLEHTNQMYTCIVPCPLIGSYHLLICPLCKVGFAD